MPEPAKYLNIIKRGIVFSRPFIPHPYRALNKYEKALEFWIEGSIDLDEQTSLEGSPFLVSLLYLPCHYNMASTIIHYHLYLSLFFIL